MPSEVILIDGEKVNIDIDSVCQQEQVFVRIGPNLIIGAVRVDGQPYSDIYIWQEIKGVYSYSGDIVFIGQKDGSILWRLYPWIYGVITEADKALDDSYRNYQTLKNIGGNGGRAPIELISSAHVKSS